MYCKAGLKGFAIDFVRQFCLYFGKVNNLSAELNLTKQQSQNLKTEITSDNKFDFEVDAFSLVREASKRTIGQRHYDVQLFGGMVLLRNKIAEMKTGEGKTLVSTLPISFMSLFDQSVHVVTVNDYLSRRDAEWMSPIYNFLGLEVGLIYSNQDYQEKVSEYKKDIVYLNLFSLNHHIE